jgi:hypothetical protein
MKDYNERILIYAKKLKAINLLGGKCKICGEDNFFKLCFHHLRDKKEKLSKMKERRWEEIEKEIRKCDLVCQNCHYEIHQKDMEETFRTQDKKFYLDYKNVNGCEICGYNKSMHALHFHHLHDKKIEFRFVKEKITSLEEIKINIMNEINKCQVLCSNCHMVAHSDVNFFKENFLKIEEKSLNLRKMSPKLDRETIKYMYFIEGKKQNEIKNHFKCSKGTISSIIKKLKENDV